METSSRTKEVTVSKGAAIEPAKMEDFYRRLRRRITDWIGSKQGRAYRYADRLLLLPDFVHLIIRLALDRRVPAELRAQTAAVLAYVVLPLDLMPEGLMGPVGFADDLLLVVLMTRRLLARVPSDVVLSHWAGRADLLRTIQGVLEVADEMVGNKLWKRLQRMVGGGGR